MENPIIFCLFLFFHVTHHNIVITTIFFTLYCSSINFPTSPLNCIETVAEWTRWFSPKERPPGRRHTMSEVMDHPSDHTLCGTQGWYSQWLWRKWLFPFRASWLFLQAGFPLAVSGLSWWLFSVGAVHDRLRFCSGLYLFLCQFW